MTTMTGLDITIEKTIKEMETKHNCLIFLLHDENNQIYMNVIYTDSLKMDVEVPMAKMDESKFTLAMAIRRHFR